LCTTAELAAIKARLASLFSLPVDHDCSIKSTKEAISPQTAASTWNFVLKGQREKEEEKNGEPKTKI